MNDLSVNRRAKFDYEILETLEVGIELFGFEVKSAKAGHAQINGSFAVIKDNQAWLIGATIPAYQLANAPHAYEPSRSRRLLLHKKEIKSLIGSAARKGLTMVPLKMYNKSGYVKLLIGLGRHKKSADKREMIKKRESAREIERTLKHE